MSLIVPVNNYRPSDEIDLLVLLANLWKQKLLIGLVTLLVTAVTSGYAFFSAPEYTSKVRVLPPTLADVADYNFAQRVGFSKKKFESEGEFPAFSNFSVDKVYSIFTKNLRSEGQKDIFFEQVVFPELSSSGEAGEIKNRHRMDFSKALVVSNVDIKNNTDLLEVSVQSDEPGRSARWVSLYVKQVGEKTRQDIAKIMLAEIDGHMRLVGLKIAALRANALQDRQEQMARLNEFLIVAEKAAEKHRATKVSSESDVEIKQFVNGDYLTLRTVSAIRAEISVLKDRTEDDPFIEGMRDFKNQISLLAGLTVNQEDFTVFTLDSAAEVSDVSIKPKKDLLVILGVIFGGMLGVFIALTRGVLFRYREGKALEVSLGREC